MPPEVAKSLPSNESVDAYSFALVMWEMVSIEQPFQFYGVNELLRMCVFFYQICKWAPINPFRPRSVFSIINSTQKLTASSKRVNIFMDSLKAGNVYQYPLYFYF